MSSTHDNSNSAPYPLNGSGSAGIAAGKSRGVTYWRVEGSLLELGALRPVLFFTWNSRSYAERWARRAGMAGMALVRPFMYAASRTFATRFLHTLLRGVSRDRLDLLGEEYFQYILKPQMRPDAVDKLIEAIRSGERVVLVSQLLDHILKPLAKHFGVESIIATGGLLDPVVRPRGPLAWVASGSTDGRITREKLLRQLGWSRKSDLPEAAVQSSERPRIITDTSVALFGESPRVEQLSVRRTLANRHIMLIGVTGFIGKVWLVNLLENIPEIGKITLLIRRNRTTSSQRRFEKIVEESPTFDTLQERYGRSLGAFLKEKVEVVEGDVSGPGP